MLFFNNIPANFILPRLRLYLSIDMDEDIDLLRVYRLLPAQNQS